MRNRRRGLRPHLDILDDRCLLSGYASSAQTGYTPAQISSAYGLNAITLSSSTGSAVKGDGSGETIALIEMYHDPNLTSDLKTFDAKYGLPNPSLTVVDQAGKQTDSGWALEESMDVEWAHAIAPGANILVVEAAPSDSETQKLTSLLNAVNTARNTAGVAVVSMSWGFDELPKEASYDSYFTTPAGHSGITFVASSGDNGSIEYPSASPNVLSVGGTTLSIGSSGSYGSETVWTSGGGGYSQYEAEPSYQNSVQSTGLRSTPDVAFDGDPSTGAQVYSTPPGSTKGSWQVVGGTSLGAPAWAGLIAIADQGRALAGKGSLDGPNQTLPALYAAASSDYYTVASASPYSPYGSGFSFGGFEPFGGFSHEFSFGFGFGFGSGMTGITTTGAGATANTSTGLGSPKGASIISDLVSTNLASPVSTAASTGHKGSGSALTIRSKPTGKGTKHPVVHRRTITRSATGHARALVHARSSTEKP
jgi:hypothetical protein